MLSTDMLDGPHTSTRRPRLVIWRISSMSVCVLPVCARHALRQLRDWFKLFFYAVRQVVDMWLATKVPTPGGPWISAISLEARAKRMASFWSR